MAPKNDLEKIQNCIGNRLDQSAIGERHIAGVIGTAPSQYSKSPALWNAAFGYLGMDAIYLPFDIDNSELGNLLCALKHCERLLGVNVTVPHKLEVIKYLDEIDSVAARIGAVNTIVRTASGRLIGHNTDGEGFIASITRPQAGAMQSLMSSLAGMTVVILGAGGAARAVAFHVADDLQDGRLVICNRTLPHGEELAHEIRKIGIEACAIGETELSHWAPQAGLIINSTTKGQGGICRLDGGTVLSMESYSSLAPANAIAIPESEYGNSASSHPDSKLLNAEIEANQRSSLALAQLIPKAASFYDLIYHPEETPFLRHGRVTGHRTMNGKSMIVCQAVLAFGKHICERQLAAQGKSNAQTLQDIAEVMYRAW